MSPHTADDLLNDLAEQELCVVVSRCTRVVVSRNPAWYRNLCAAFPKHRKRPRAKKHPDTRIVRRDVLRLLERVSAGLPVRSYIIEHLDRHNHDDATFAFGANT